MTKLISEIRLWLAKVSANRKPTRQPLGSAKRVGPVIKRGPDRVFYSRCR